jgi:colicin import membrane protein
MKAGVTTSVIAHAALLIVAIVGLGSAKPMEPEAVESIAVDLVPISEFTNIRQGSLKSTVVETETPAVVEDNKPAELAQPTGNTQENQVDKQETAKVTPAPATNSAPAPTAAPEPQPVPQPVKPPEPTPPPPVQAPDPAPTPEPAAPTTELATPETPDPVAPPVPAPAVRTASLEKLRADYQKQLQQEKQKQAEEQQRKLQEQKAAELAKQQQQDQARAADEINNIINNEQSRGATTGSGGTPTLGKTTGTAATLSQSQLDGLIAQIKNCPYYNPPIGASEAGATAQLRFSIDASGNVPGMPQIVSSGQSQMERALASAAQRGVMRCGPYTMATNQDVQATFDPRLM